MRSFVIPAALVPSVLGATLPTVSLLIDNGYASSGTLNLRSTLKQVSTRKGAAFHFGSTYEASYANQTWVANVFSTYFNHIVAESSCKWGPTEPARGTSSLSGCKAVQAFAFAHNATFRGHNTFWHEHLPAWLPGNVSASDLVDNVIPQHVQQEIQGMGANVTSWDVVNEIVGDGVTKGMTALQCVQQKGDWPTVTADGGSTPLVKDLSFVHAAFSTALKYAPASARLAINDYSTGGTGAKTACMFPLLADLVANASIPYSRLAVAFQSHVSGAPGKFVGKADLAATFAQLDSLGAHGIISELDIKLNGSDSAGERYQAAIWGDYLDVCLYAPNCFEFLNWNLRDDMSWLGTAGAGTLFDASGNPKPAAYEVAARLQRYASGATELCETSMGTSTCTVPKAASSQARGSQPVSKLDRL